MGDKKGWNQKETVNFSTCFFLYKSLSPESPRRCTPEQPQQVENLQRLALPETSAVTDSKEGLAQAKKQTCIFPPHPIVFLLEVAALCIHPDLCHCSPHLRTHAQENHLDLTTLRLFFSSSASSSPLRLGYYYYSHCTSHRISHFSI